MALVRAMNTAVRIMTVCIVAKSIVTVDHALRFHYRPVIGSGLIGHDGALRV